MTDHEIIEKLARAACISAGRDPDRFPDGPIGSYWRPLPWYSPDGLTKPWHAYVESAQRFLAFYREITKPTDEPHVSKGVMGPRGPYP